jgi:magnesium transporter
VIVDAAWYDGTGQRTAEFGSIGELGEPLAKARAARDDGFAWLGLRMPLEPELLEAQETFRLPQLAVDDVRNRHDRPKVEQHDDMLLTVLPTARYDDGREQVEFGELFLLTGDDYLVSMRYGHAAPLSGVRAMLEANPERLRLGVGAVLQAALAQVVDSYVPVVHGLEGDVREVERDVFSESRKQPTRRIYFLIREVLDFLVAVEPLSAALTALTSARCSRWVHEELVPLFRDIEEALAAILERSHQLQQLLNNSLAANMAQVSIRQNEDTRRISAWAAIGVFPTVIAGLFGMNLGGIPGSDDPIGFIAVTGVTLLLCWLLYRRFKDADWL